MADPTLIHIFGQLRDAPLEGDQTATVTFRSTQYVRHIDGTVLEPFKVIGVADTTGHVSMYVPPTNDPVWSPVGWTYRVSIDPADGSPVVPFDVVVPYDASGAALTLGQVLPAGSPSLGVLYAAINHTHTPDQVGFRILATGAPVPGGTPAGTVIIRV
jgi:hypothetical protein